MPRICAGCNKSFASNEAFELHATGAIHPSPDAPRRCRTADEMHALGLSRRGPAHSWTVNGQSKRAKHAHATPSASTRQRRRG